MQTIELPTNCDRAAAAALYTDFVEATSDAATKVDASKVEKLGMAMLQLLLSADQSGGGIECIGASEAFSEAVETAGLREVISTGDAS